MKNTLLSLLAVVVLVGVASAQYPGRADRSFQIMSKSNYTNSSKDTTLAVNYIGGFTNVALLISASDSVSFSKVYIDRQPEGRATSVWSLYDSLATLADTSNASSAIISVLKGGAVDKLGGPGAKYRFRFELNSSGNGSTTSRQYIAKLLYSN